MTIRLNVLGGRPGPHRILMGELGTKLLILGLLVLGILRFPRISYICRTAETIIPSELMVLVEASPLMPHNLANPSLLLGVA